jgi:hypothetical protein
MSTVAMSDVENGGSVPNRRRLLALHIVNTVQLSEKIRIDLYQFLQKNLKILKSGK